MSADQIGMRDMKKPWLERVLEGGLFRARWLMAPENPEFGRAGLFAWRVPADAWSRWSVTGPDWCERRRILWD